MLRCDDDDDPIAELAATAAAAAVVNSELINSISLLRLSSREKYRPIDETPNTNNRPPINRNTIPVIHMASGIDGDDPKTIKMIPIKKMKPAIQQHRIPSVKYLLGVST
mgnify:CR=1 FL=1